MITNLQAVVALCAGTGFFIVWLAFPAKKAPGSTGEGEATSAAGDTSSPPPGDEPKPEFTYQEPQMPQSPDSGYRPRWCDILLLEPDASPDAIRKAYARLMKGLHPDIAGANEQTSRQCALVQNAYKQAMQDRQAGA